MIKKVSIILFVLFILVIIVPIHAEDGNNTTSNNTKTYTDLTDEINNNTESTIELNNSYKYNSTTDSSLVNGVVISRNITVIGYNNTTIDGSYLVRGFTIESNCNVVLENLTFINGYSTTSGGAIVLKTNSTLTLKNCVFENNTVYNANGGALSCKVGTTTEIYDCLFINNTSIRESDLEWEEFKKGMGSAICVGINSHLGLTNTHFRKNNAYLSTILVISYDDVTYQISSLYISKCSFENNTSKRSGIIYLDELGIGEIHDSVFRNNNVTETSGTVILESSVYALVQNCLFEANSGIRGGAINLKYFNETPSNVYVINCTFIKNFANVTGGAIYSNHGNLTVINSTFKDNEALANGGGIYTNIGQIKIIDCDFRNNKAAYGGALSLSSENSSVENSIFVENSATQKGGAIYSKMQDINNTNLVFINNNCDKGSDVYGAFTASITNISTYFEDIVLKINLASTWNMSLEQYIKVKFTGPTTYTTGWLKTNTKGELTIKNINLDYGNYAVEITCQDGFGYNNQTVSIVSAPTKISIGKITTTYDSGKLLKFYAINNETGKYIPNAKITLKVYTGSSYKSYTLTSDKNGLFKFDTSKVSGGKHTIVITAKNKNIKLVQEVKSTITINKATAKLKYSKTVKKNKKIQVTVKNKASGKVIKNLKFSVKIHGKTQKIKTNSKGVLKISTNKLKKGKYKVTITHKDGNYNINNKIQIRIK